MWGMMRCALAVGWSALLASAAGAQDAAPDPYAVLARVKAGLRATEKPPYVAYTLVRRETLDAAPDFLNSYTLRIWCRTADSAALAREVSGSRTVGPVRFVIPAFDKPVDPGPPTADLLDVVEQFRSVPATSAPAPDSPPVIGTVHAFIERDYRVSFAGIERGDYHLRLEPRHDPDRNRLTDLYVDRAMYAIHRAVARDHLYTPEHAIPERFEIEFGSHDGIPVMLAIHGQTDDARLDASVRGEPFHAVEYRFEAISFPPTLPDWFFEPAHYGDHRSEFPQ